MLAGGRSTRFGRDKLAESYRGIPLLHHTILRLADVCDELVVVLSPEAPEPDLPVGVTARFARDPVEGEGPLAGAQTGLLASHSDLALLAGGDMPELSTPVLLEMLRSAGQREVEAVALQDGDRFRPLPCVVRVGRAVDLAEPLLSSGHRRLRELLVALALAVIEEATWRALDPYGRTLFDVDEPGDLER